LIPYFITLVKLISYFYNQAIWSLIMVQTKFLVPKVMIFSLKIWTINYYFEAKITSPKVLILKKIKLFL